MGKTTGPGTLANQAFSDEAQYNTLPGGYLDYAEMVTPATVSAETGLTDLTISFTVPANPSRPAAKRMVKLIAYTGNWTNPNGAAVGEIRIRAGVTGNPEVAFSRTNTTATAQMGARCERILQLDPGSYSYYATFAQVAGTGSASFGASASRPAWIVAEDLGEVPAAP